MIRERNSLSRASVAQVCAPAYWDRKKHILHFGEIRYYLLYGSVPDAKVDCQNILLV